MGRHATWYIPAAFGIYNVVQAPSELKMRTLFAEGFGVLGGAFGTYLGSLAGVGIATILGLGPFGLFVAVFVCAGYIGYKMSEQGKLFGGKAYDIGHIAGDQIFNSADQFLGAF